MDKAEEFQAYVSSHLNSLYNYARLLAHPPDDADDLLQDSLVRGLRGFASFDRALSFKAWMFTIIKRAHIDRQRRRRVRPVEENLGEDAVASASAALSSPLYSIPFAPEDILVRQETIQHVRDTIRRLPRAMREAVELRDIEGFSYREIATIVHCPIGTVMSRLYRGRNLLRIYLVEPRRHDGRTTRISHGL